MKYERCGEVNPAQEPEPVAWQCAECGGTHSLCLENRKDIPLYTAPPQRQSEPVGWIYEDDEGRMIFSQMPHPDPLCEPVYRAAPKRKWVGLTKKETLELLEKNIDRPFSLLVAVRDKLKANNDR